MDTLNFSAVIDGLKSGAFFARTGWNGKGMYLALQKPDINSKMTLPYIYMVVPTYNADGTRGIVNLVPWIASQSDLLAEDWFKVDTQGSRAIAN